MYSCDCFYQVTSQHLQQQHLPLNTSVKLLPCVLDVTVTNYCVKVHSAMCQLCDTVFVGVIADGVNAALFRIVLRSIDSHT